MWVIVTFCSLVLIVLYYKFIKIYNYWKDKNVPYVNLIHCFHNYASHVFRTSSLAKNFQEIYRKYPEARYIGFYQYFQPVLLVRDPELVKKITIKDFGAFTDHNTFVTEDADPLWMKNIFIMSNEEGWHETRSSISRLFTANRMRSMLILMKQCSDQFLNYLKKNNDEVTVEMNELFTRYANDVIGSTFFGITCDSYKDRNNDYYLMVRNVSALSNLLGFQHIGYYFSPILMKMLDIKVFKKVPSRFFRNLIKSCIKVRVEKKIVHPDLINLLIEANVKIKKSKEISAEQRLDKDQKLKLAITEEDITANSIIFFFAGFDAVAHLLSYIAYELAANFEVQSQVYDEIRETALYYDGNFSYEAVRSMKYLHNVIIECIRIHPPSDILDRKSVKPYLLEAEKPGETSLLLEKGSWVWILSGCIQTDEKYYSNSEKFDPDRFSNKNTHSNTQCTYLPFGSGPRKCIGSRFVLLECKLVIINLMQKYALLPVEERKPQGNGVWVTLKRRK